MPKRIKTKNLDPSKMVSKSQYAKDIKSTPTTVQRMIDRGELTVVVYSGAECIHL